MEVLFLTVCSFLFFAGLPSFVLPCILFAISTGILHAALHFLSVFLFVHTLTMRYGTVVCSVSKGDIGYHSRLEKYWMSIRELPVASCTGELHYIYNTILLQIKSREIRCRYGIRTALRFATSPPCYHTPYYLYHTPWYRTCLECGSETPV